MHQHSNRWRRINGAIAASTGSLAIVAAYASIATAAELTGWQFDPATQQLQVTIPAGTTPRYFLLAQPARIVLDLPNTQVGNVTAQQSFGGAVRQIRVGQFDATSTRIVMELSPDAELAPGQVELQQASSTGNRTQWVLRPLLTGSAIAAQPAPRPATSPSIAPPAEPAVIPVVPPVAIAPSPIPPVPQVAVPPAVTSPPALPPLEPNAIEIPVAPAAAVSPPELVAPAESNVAPSAAVQLEAQVTTFPSVGAAILPSASATSTVTLNSLPAPAVRLPDRPAEPTLPARDPIMLPPAIEDLPSQPAIALPMSVQVPPIVPIAPPAAPPAIQAAAPVAIELPPALPPQAAPSQVIVPPLNPIAPPSRPPVAPTENPAGNVEFGQPLPAPPSLNARRSSILLPAGTVLSLRYPREAAIEVESGRPRQEVLVLQAPVRNQVGETILPTGTQVIGRFEVDREGGRFVAQAISIEGRNIRLNGASAATSSDRSSSGEDLIVHSALGALALTLLGGLSGLSVLGGAAAGAATTYLAPPDAIVIQPNQVFEVRLTEDVPQ